MIEIHTPQSFTLNHFMCSQSGNLQDLATCSGHSPSCILESDTEPDSSSRQDLLPSLTTDMGLEYMTIRATDDVRFSDPGTSHSPVYSIEPNIHHSNSPTSLAAYIQQPYHPNIYQSSLSGSNYSSSGSYFSPSSSLFSMPEIKPRLGALSSSTGMAPSSRSPGLPHLTSPREIYTGATPVLRRGSDILSRSPSISGGLRGVPLSPTSSGFASPTNMENSLGGQGASPPLNPTEVLVQLRSSEGMRVEPDIYGKIDKGFFLADNDWTCYRRNYFSLNCSYTLSPLVPVSSIHIVQGGSSSQVIAFALSIAAVVDGRDGKSIELVQHTPKRDKGPQEKPARITLAPRPPIPGSIYGGDSGLGSGSRGLYDQGYGQNPNQPPTEATFERIQFKNATANNGKRRAAQQYYHLLVELFADIGPQHQDRWVKVATRMSAAMVVRGRSPGHYQSERRGSNASTGPGSGGAGGAGSYTPSGSTSRTPGDISMSGTNSMLPSSGYGHGSYDTRSHHYRSNDAHSLINPVLAVEDIKGIEEPDCYMYYPHAIYEGHETRYHLPSVSEFSNQKIKQEFSSTSGYILPSLSSTQDSLGRQCGRWEGIPESKGYFPSATIQHEMNLA